MLYIYNVVFKHTKKIVIIEDDKVIRENLIDILKLSGYDALPAKSGKSGIQLIEHSNPDLIICDTSLPELDGYGVLHILNNKPTLSHIPFVFLNAKASDTDFRKGMNLGASDYITKPFDVDELLNIVEIRLNKAHIIKENYYNNIKGISSFFVEAKAQLALNSLMANRDTKIFSKKESIYYKEKKAFNLFYLISGKVKLFETNKQGKELILQLIHPNEFFGYTALVQNKPYSCFAAALENCEVCMIPKDDFLNLMYQDVHVSQKFIQLLGNDIEAKEHKLISMAYGSVKKRVAESLIELAQAQRTQNEKKPTKIYILREDLAALVGTAKETAIRALCDLKAAGHIAIENKYIEILNFKALKNF